MRLNQKKVENVILSILGEEGSKLVKEMYGKENVSEFDLANRTKKDIKIIRKMLYALHNNNLVAFTRKKDKDKGWYIYYWTIVPENITYLYLKKKKEKLEMLKNKLGEENKELFFVCGNNCIRLNFDQAIEFEFHCPECGDLVMQDEKREIEPIKQEILDIEEELSGENAKHTKRAKAASKKVSSKLKKSSVVKKIIKKIRKKKR